MARLERLNRPQPASSDQGLLAELLPATHHIAAEWVFHVVQAVDIFSTGLEMDVDELEKFRDTIAFRNHEGVAVVVPSLGVKPTYLSRCLLWVKLWRRELCCG